MCAWEQANYGSEWSDIGGRLCELGQCSARGHYLPLIRPELAIFSFIFLDHTRGKEGLSAVGKGQYGYKEVISGGKKGLSGVEDG